MIVREEFVKSNNVIDIQRAYDRKIENLRRMRAAWNRITEARKSLNRFKDLPEIEKVINDLHLAGLDLGSNILKESK